MSDTNRTLTPTTGAPVGVDLDGLYLKEDWEYASVVGILMYLVANTVADVANADPQATIMMQRVCSLPKCQKCLPVPSTLVCLITGLEERYLH